MGFLEAIDETIVYDAAAGVADRCVKRLSIGQAGCIVGDPMLDRGQSAFSEEFDAAHVGNIEESGMLANFVVFSNDPFVLDRHLPTCKVDDAGVMGFVFFVEGSAAGLLFGHCECSLFGSLDFCGGGYSLLCGLSTLSRKRRKERIHQGFRPCC